jgi:hypothetical protein
MATDLGREHELRALIDLLIDDKLARVIEQQLPALVAARLADPEALGALGQKAHHPRAGQRLIRQGYPIASIDQLRADFWPEGEPVEEIESTIDRWRHDDERG